MPKPFKDWGVVNFLQDKIGGAAKQITDVVIRGESPLKAATDLIFGEAGGQLTEAEKKHALELARQDHEEWKLMVQDRQDARAQQVAISTSGESTHLAKNFIYYFAGGIVALVFLIIILLFWIEIPADNKRIIDILLGAFVSILSSIGAYFFGSSTGSKNKEQMLGNVVSKIKPK